MRGCWSRWPRSGRVVPELRAVGFSRRGEAIARLADTIERERAAGAAPPDADSRALAASLIWTAERSFHVAMTGAHRILTDQDSLVEPLLQLFVGTIYGRAAMPG